MILKIKNFWLAQVISHESGEMRALKSILTYKETQYRSTGRHEVRIPFYELDKPTGEIYVPIGLLNYLYKKMANKGYKIIIENLDKFKGHQVSMEDMHNFFDNELALPDFYTKREWQLETVMKMLNGKITSINSSVNSGKTFLTYMYFTYISRNPELFRVKKKPKFLVIVPRVDLARQNLEAYMECDTKKEFKYEAIYAGSPHRDENADVKIWSFQSGKRKVEMEEDWFKQFDVVIVDEAHTTRSDSVKAMCVSSVNTRLRTGMTGTYPKEGSLDYFKTCSILGAIVQNISLKFMQDRGESTKIHIHQYQMKYNYVNPHFKENIRGVKGAAGLAVEKKSAFYDQNRIEHILKIIDEKHATSTLNHLVAFNTEDHGLVWKDILSKKYGEDRVFFINGKTAKKKRKQIIKEFESGRGNILVGSFGTISMGVNVKTIEHTFMVEGFKSFYNIVQLLGRQARTHNDKQMAYLHDFVDELKKPMYCRYTLKLPKHGKERVKIYIDEQQPYDVINVSFNSPKVQVWGLELFEEKVV